MDIKETTTTAPLKEFGRTRSALYGISDFCNYDPDSLRIKKGNMVYESMMLDDQVKAVIAFKKHAVLSRSWFFDCDDESQQEMADFFYFVVKSICGSFTDKLLGILSALHNGYSVSEKVYQVIEWNGKPMWGIKDLKLKPFETFNGGFEVDPYGNLLALKQNIGGQYIDIPTDKVVMFVHQPDYDPHYGQSDLRACYRAYWSKDIAIKFQNIHMERHAGGFYWAQVDGILGDTERIALEKVLKNITANTAMIMPKEVNINHAMPVNTDVYERAIAQYDKAIAKAVLVPNLLGITEQGTTGSYAQSQTQVDAFFWTLDTIAKRLEEALNEQVFRELAKWNFGTDNYPEFRFDPMSPSIKAGIIQSFGDLVQKGAITKTEDDEKYIRQLMNLPEYEIEEEPEEEEPEGMMPEVEQEPAETEEPEPEVIEEPEEDDIPLGNEQYMAKFADKPWMQRVDFARTARVMDDKEQKMSTEMADIMGRIKQALSVQVSKMSGGLSFGNIKPAAVNMLEIPKNLLSDLRKAIRTNLQDTLETGTLMAEKELPKKMFAKVIKPGMDINQAEKYLASRAMQITGVLDSDVLKAVQNILYNAISYDKSLRDTMDAMAKDTKLIELLPETDAAGRAVNIPARLENIARTNIADAINKGRETLFNKPELEGFIQAYEYSAILDSRTSDICQALDGKIRKDFGVYTPPNHYQCRSLLIPVTVIDGWDGKQDNLPAVKPQEGFGKEFAS